MKPASYQVTIDGETWTVTQDESGRIFASGPDGDSQPAFIGSWNPITS